MTLDLLDVYGRGSDWTQVKVAAPAGKLDDSTTCSKWTVRELLNHTIDTPTSFVRAALVEDIFPPSPEPPTMFDDDPLPAFDRPREEVLDTFAQDGVVARRQVGGYPDISLRSLRTRRLPALTPAS